MPTVDPRVDVYIEKSADFAKPILTHIRKLVHKACPDVQETMKWSIPHSITREPSAVWPLLSSTVRSGFGNNH